MSYRDDDGEVRVRSVWWRSGWLGSTRWTTHDEIGEGWLVLAHPAVLPALEKILGEEVRIVWEVERDFMVSGQSQRRALHGVHSPHQEQTAEPGAPSR